MRKLKGRFTSRAVLCAVLLSAFFAFSSAVWAQLPFTGYQSIQKNAVSTGLSGPMQIAIDGSGNMYIADAGSGRILKETPGTGGYTQTVAVSGLNSPRGVAVDSSGNLYIADSFSNRVLKETLSNGKYVESVLDATGLYTPLAVAVDAVGNVYVADNATRFVKETLSGGSYTQSSVLFGTQYLGTATSIAVDTNGDVLVSTSGPCAVVRARPNNGSYDLGIVASALANEYYCGFGIAGDGKGNIFLADGIGQQALEFSPEPPGNFNYSAITIDQDLKAPSGLAVDPAGHVFISDDLDNRVVEDTLVDGNFGSVEVGKQSAPISLIFAVPGLAEGGMDTPTALSQGITGSDFVDAGTGSCSAKGTKNTYNNERVCTIDLIFKPTAPGLRQGAGALIDSNGDILPGEVFGTGTGPMVNFSPPGPIAIAKGLSSPEGIAVDAAGDVFVVNSGDGTAVKEAPASNGYSATKFGSALSQTGQMIIDGAGTIDIAQKSFNGGVGQIVSLRLLADGSYFQTVIGGPDKAPGGVATDGYGNFYFADSGQIQKIVKTEYGFFQTVILDGGSDEQMQLGMDGLGNLYISNWVAGAVVKETLTNGKYVQSTVVSGLSSTLALAADWRGNVYIADGGNNRLLKETLSGESYSQTVLMEGLKSPGAVAVDKLGNIYVSDTGSGQVFKIDVADAPSLTFASASVGTASSDSPKTVTLLNAGNAALSFPVLATGNNPAISTGFALDSSGESACAVVAASSSSAGSLAAGGSCDLAISFVPQAQGAVTGSLTLTDNSLNAAAPGYAKQSIALSGTGTMPVKTAAAIYLACGTGFNWTNFPAVPPDPAVFLMSPVTCQVLTGSIPSVPTGSVTFLDGATQLATMNLSGGGASFTTSVLMAGTHLITASYSGDAHFSSASSAPWTTTVQDFSLGYANGGTGSVSAGAGGQAVYSLVVTPLNGGTLPGSVTMGVTGLPAGATATFSPGMVASGAGTTTVTMTIQLPSQAGLDDRGTSGMFGKRFLPISLALMLLPMAGRLKRGSKSIRRALDAGTLVLIGAFFLCAGGLVACGGGGKTPTQPQTYSLTVSAVGGGVLTHSVTGSLVVQ